MGGSEGVMQVADYGEIQFETWLNSSYGTISPNRNHTNETINAFRISSSGDIDGRNWIFTTGSYGIWKNMLPNSFKKWWLRSPDTNVFDASDCAWNVRHFGDVDYYNGVWDSYGRTSSRRARVILSVRFSSLFPVTPASTMVVLILSTFPTGLSA